VILTSLSSRSAKNRRLWACADDDDAVSVLKLDVPIPDVIPIIMKKKGARVVAAADATFSSPRYEWAA
jgi:hypothetical protein